MRDISIVFEILDETLIDDFFQDNYLFKILYKINFKDSRHGRMAKLHYVQKMSFICSEVSKVFPKIKDGFNLWEAILNIIYFVF